MRSRTGSVGRKVFLRGLIGLLLVGALAVGVPLVTDEPQAVASAAAKDIAPTATMPVALGRSGLPIPRFVSLKKTRVNVRVGPGEDYPVAWTFTRSDLPVEIVAEFDNWRRIRDSDGSVGWVFHGLLSGTRTAVVAPWADQGAEREAMPIRSGAVDSASVTAYLQPGVLATLDRCMESWCRLSGDGFAGWIEQTKLWGAYPGETVD